MSEATSQEVVQPPPAESISAPAPALPIDAKVDDIETPVANGTVAEASDPANEVATTEVALEPVAPPAIVEAKDQENTNNKQTEDVTDDKPATTEGDNEMKEDIQPNEEATAAADESGDAAASSNKSKGRRKSGPVPEHKNKKLNKKASKAKMTHTDAQPGDYFMIRLKGYPLWPGIICDESMLPNSLLKNRPVTAMRQDGTYRADYEDGGPKVKDRTFPVMYLHTNEFGWIPNYDLVDMDWETVGNVSPNIRKDLYAAHLLAAEKHNLEYFKEILQSFMQQRAADLEAKEAAKAAKKASKAKRKSKATVDEDEEGDVDMPDAAPEADSEEAEAPSGEKKGTKRKATDAAEGSPQTDSVKKPKTTLKLLNNTPKTTNGASIPKAAKDQSAHKPAKPKSSKKTAPKTAPEVVAAKDPELTPEEKRVKKEKEILFLRHKLQKGLLSRDQEPKEEEMKQMSEFVSKLEGYADLEVSIIRATKINKVLKAILKLHTIPKEEDFQFKPRSQSLLDKWNKLLASEQGTPVAAPAAAANGVGEEAKTEVEDSKETPNATTNGTKESSTEEKIEEKAPEAEPTSESKETVSKVDDVPAPSIEEPTQEVNPEPTPIRSTT